MVMSRAANPLRLPPGFRLSRDHASVPTLACTNGSDH
jgi:hypothetical protein